MTMVRIDRSVEWGVFTTDNEVRGHGTYLRRDVTIQEACIVEVILALASSPALLF